jgi:cyclopropane fatty-acyl-phospholipid synthase-like methyltransferase
MNGKHDVALWAGAVAFFGSLIAIGIFDILNPDQWQEYFGAIIVAVITGGSVYAKQRYDDAKEAKEAEVRPPTTHRNRK